MTPLELLELYKLGYFPMAKSRDDDAFDVVAPYTRALLPIKSLHIPKRLRRKILQFPFHVSVNADFARVVEMCADVRAKAGLDTWINDHIISLFLSLHEMGYAHSVECRSEGGELVGGLYGTVLGSAFCGESMFSIQTDASKVALVHLCARLNQTGFQLLDSQFRNPHLDQFGLYEMPQDDYVSLLASGLRDTPDFLSLADDEATSVRRYLNSR